MRTTTANRIPTIILMRTKRRFLNHHEKAGFVVDGGGSIFNNGNGSTGTIFAVSTREE
jgi:hypothetical protein